MTSEPRTVLGIEASNPSRGAPGGVCVGRPRADGFVEVLGEQLLDRCDRGTDGVMLAVDRACATAGIGPGSVDAVAVSIGPGGYTALRIATVTAKTLAYAIGCRVIPVPTPAVAGEAVGSGLRPALIALASKKGAAYLSGIGADGSVDAVGVRGADWLVGGHWRSIVSDEHLPEEMVRRAERLGIERVEIRLGARALLAASVRYEAVDPGRVCPVYAREPDAVTQWRARRARPPR